MCGLVRDAPAAAASAAAAVADDRAALLLELAAADDLLAFRLAVEGGAAALDAEAPWYGPASGGRFALRGRSPLMVAAIYGSFAVAGYIIAVSPGEAARASSSDGATPLHLAAAGASPNALDVAKLLVLAGASPDAVDAAGSRAGDLIRRGAPLSAAAADSAALRALLKSPVASPSSSPTKRQEGKTAERKEYPPDLTLPDINTGVFITDEFRMYGFKVRPCSRAYSHDWTECPFAHPGENARRRDPRRFSYSCVPCPDFRKSGACKNGDACEYAHGVFECWLHPAQYRTRLCKDETTCRRRICFFAHSPSELRSVNPSAVSVASGLDMSSATLLQMPSLAGSPASLQGSRLKPGLSGHRDLKFDIAQYQQALLEPLSSPLAGRNYSDLLGSVDPLLLSQLHGLSLPSSPVMVMNSPTAAADRSLATAILNSRAAAFAKRSQSFVDRSHSPVGASPKKGSPVTPPPGMAAPSLLSGWGSPDGKLNWGVQTDELSKLRKSATFAYRAPQPASPEPDVSWVNSLIKDSHGNGVAGEMFGQWLEQEQLAA